MSVTLYTPDSSKIIHETRVDFRQRVIPERINLVQYDKSLPIVAVKLYNNGIAYALPENSDVSIRWGKRDHTFVYNSALGCNLNRTIVYFEITEQMTIFYGEHTPIIELRIGETLAGSGFIPFYLDRNPIQEGDAVSSVELGVLEQYILEAKQSATEAKESSEYIRNATVPSGEFTTVLPTAISAGQYWIFTGVEGVVIGGKTWHKGDYAMWDGSSFIQIDNTTAVRSVNGMNGSITLDYENKFYAINLYSNNNLTSIGGWLSINPINLYLTVASNILSFKGTAQYSGIYRSYTPIVGHKYYFFANVKSTSSNVGLYVSTIGIAKSHSGSGSFERLSCITSPLDNASNSTFRVSDYRSSNWTETQVKYIGLIDLTALQGFGKEWSVERMDNYMAYKYENSYFDTMSEFRTQVDEMYWNATKIKATNMIIDGSFKELLNWTSYQCTTTVNSNIASSIGSSGGNNYFALFQDIAGCIINHSYLVRAKIRTTNSGVTSIKLSNTPSTPSGQEVINPVQNTWYDVYFITVATASGSLRFQSQLLATDVANLTLQTQYAIMLDLTSAFYAGNEPTASEAMLMLSVIPNKTAPLYWFDGTQDLNNILYLSNSKANKLQDDFIVPTLLNGVTTPTSFKYRLNNMGELEISGQLYIASGAPVTACVLNAKYRPTYANLVIPSCYESLTGNIILYANGELKLQNNGRNNINIVIPIR